MQIEVWHISGDGFHFGRHGLGQEESGEHVHSDTLFAALMVRLVELRGAAEVERWVNALNSERPPFVLSSAFPRAGEMRFFPTPLRLPASEELPRGVRPKDLKQVKLVSEGVFRQVAGGKSLVELIAGERVKRLHGGSVLVEKNEWSALPKAVQLDATIWNIEKRPRVTVGRAAHNSQIYFTGRTVFQPGCGLWFGVRWVHRAEAMAALLSELAHDLGYAGLGGERSAGFGQCVIERSATLELPDAVSGPWVSLSRYLPRPDEMEALTNPSFEAAYAVQAVSGWVTSPVDKNQRRRVVRLLAEGAVLGPVSRMVPGQIVDVRPVYGDAVQLPHPVWRSGLALAVGMNLAAKGKAPS